MRGSFPASHAVLPTSARAIQGLEGGTFASVSVRFNAVQLLRSYGVDLSRSDSTRSPRLQSLRQLRYDAAGKRDTLRGVRTEEEQTPGASTLTRTRSDR
jgi:hypothetical protein